MRGQLLVFTAVFCLVFPSWADWARDQIGLTALGAQDCSGVVIAYIDTGVDFNSPYLENALWRNPNPQADDIHGYDFVHQTGEVRDLDGHGTSVSHIIAANTGNPDTMGVCSKAQIMALKINEHGSASLEAIHSALDYAIEKRAQIILMTTGLILQNGLPPFGIKSKIAKATKNGALFIHAAANLSAVPPLGSTHPRQVWSYLVPDRFHPIQNAISIGGSTEQDLPWLGGFRNPNKVHLAAPAEGITLLNGQGEQIVENGNSLAAGFAAGIAAAYWTANPHLNAQQVTEALKATSVKKQAYLLEMESGRLSLENLMRGDREDAPRFEVLGQRRLEGGTEHPYAVPQRTEWTFTQEGASFVRLVFAYVNLGNCWDLKRQTKVTVLDGEDLPVQEFVCENLASKYHLPTVFVPGEKITVRFESTETQNLFRPGLSFRFLEWGKMR